MTDLVGNPEDRFSCDATHIDFIQFQVRSDVRHVPEEEAGQEKQ